ncbi:hypothetical protein VPNG_02272 [Cytospora leucostoma]|uniref:Uncharacterized protein n=1 Tax=Cytospora leucostoma TaxID=1230097 RepID=A0A423XGP4_9PEZI|nr:hypothetical protein VPNG_02272 [Cytospora leucostoma]
MHFKPARRRRFSVSTPYPHPHPPPPQLRRNGAMPYDSRPPGDDRRLLDHFQLTVTDIITNLNLDDAPAALNDVHILPKEILAESEIIAETVLAGLTIYFRDTGIQALETDPGTARLHAQQLIRTTRLLTTPGALPSKSLDDRLHGHALHHQLSDREVPALLHLNRKASDFGRILVRGSLTGS